MTAAKLKECPFCGSPAKLNSYSSCDCCGKAYNGRVSCTNSKCEAELSHFDTDELAIAAWNTRAPAGLLGRVKEGWKLRSVNCYESGGGDYEAVLYRYNEHKYESHYGTGPTPEQAVDDAGPPRRERSDELGQ